MTPGWSFLFSRLLHRAAECPQDMAGGFSPSDLREREREVECAQHRSHSTFHNLILEATDSHFYHILRLTRAYPATAWQEAIPEFHELQEIETFRGHLGGLATMSAVDQAKFHLKVHHVGSGELIYTASVAHLFERHKVKIQI